MNQWNCMTLIAGKSASAGGRVMVAHNEDDSGRFAVRHGYVPAADWPKGAVLPAEPGCARIPQVEHTFGYYWSEVRAPEGGLSNADAFYNERGVVITSNSCGQSREDLSDASRLTDGGIAYNLRRALAERSASARDGLRVLIDLVETWGYAPSARAYTIADKDEAFMVQIVSGKHYLGGRVPDGHVAVMPNHYTFHTLEDVPEMFYSKDLIAYAIGKGWYAPAVDGCYDDFDFAKAYQSPDMWRDERNVLRQKYSLEMLLGREWDVDALGLPFCVPAERAVCREDFMAMLSNHYEGTCDDGRVGPGRSPHDTPTRRVCCATTIEGFVCEMEERPELTTLWTSFGRPCQQPWLPLHPLCGLPDVLDDMGDPARAMASHLLPDPDASVWHDTAWQRMRDFGNAAEMVYSDVIGEVSGMKKWLYEAASEQNAQAIARARELFAQGSPQRTMEGMQALRRMSAQAAADALKAMEALRASFPRAAVEQDAPIVLRPGATCRLIFVCPAAPREDSLRMGVCRAKDHGQYAAAVPGSLAELDDGRFAAEFPADPILNFITSGLHECFLGGTDADGRAFVGAFKTVVEK